VSGTSRLSRSTFAAMINWSQSSDLLPDPRDSPPDPIGTPTPDLQGGKRTRITSGKYMKNLEQDYFSGSFSRVLFNILKKEDKLLYYSRTNMRFL